MGDEWTGPPGVPGLEHLRAVLKKDSDSMSFFQSPSLQMVLKINGIFEARRGKKRMKRVSQSTESSSGRGWRSHIKAKDL